MVLKLPCELAFYKAQPASLVLSRVYDQIKLCICIQYNLYQLPSTTNILDKKDSYISILRNFSNKETMRIKRNVFLQSLQQQLLYLETFFHKDIMNGLHQTSFLYLKNIMIPEQYLNLSISKQYFLLCKLSIRLS